MNLKSWPKALLGVAVAMATIASGVYAYYAYGVAYDQAKLATTPRLQLAYVDQSDQEFNGIVLRNVGAGRAQFQALDLFVEGKRIGATTDEGWKPVLSRLGLNRPEVYTLSLTSGVYLKGDSELRILGVLKKDLTLESKAALVIARNHLQLSGCYCPEIGECAELLSPGLSDSPCERGTPRAKQGIGK